MAEERNGDERHEARHAHRPSEERLLEMRGEGAEREHERREQIERRLLRHAQQRAEDDLAPVAADHLPDGRALDAVVLQQRAEYRRLQDAEPDVEAYPD